MQRLAWTIFLLLLGVGGCAARGPAELKLPQRLEELAQREAQAQRQIEELNNRLFLLEDKVDTGRVALESSGKPPQLPVIRLTPRAESEDESAPREEPPPRTTQTPTQTPAPTPRVAERYDDDTEDQPDDDVEEPSSGGKSMVEQRSVVYGGAAKRGGPRPLLRLHESGASPAPSLARVGPLPGPDPMTVTERLPVVPIPRRADAKKAEGEAKKADGAAKKADGEARKAEGEAKKAEGEAKKNKAGGAPPGVDTSPAPMREYNEAMSKYKAGQYAAAADAFRRFLRKHTQHAYADNAVYWMGECAYDTRDYRSALKRFRQVVEDYPTGNKAPDALLKMAYCYIRLKEEQNARTVLAQVVESFPKSQVARLASETLAKLQ